MTSIYRKEERECIYQSEKPFPKHEDFSNLYFCDQSKAYDEAVESWFKNAKHIVVKEGEEEKFFTHLMLTSVYELARVGKSNGLTVEKILSEGVDIDQSCYQIRSIFFEETKEGKQYLEEQAVFVDSVPKGLKFIDTELQKRFDEIPEDFKNEVRNKLMEPHAKGKVTEWISVKDRLPKEDGQYLIFKNRDIEFVAWSDYHNCWDTSDGDDFMYKSSDKRITHWMPLPLPPPPNDKP